MGKKRLFQILDDMNVNDTQNSTQLVGVCTTMVSAVKSKQGTSITMGAPGDVVMKLMDGELMPVLLLINKEEYFKRNKQETQETQTSDLPKDELIKNLIKKYNPQTMYDRFEYENFQPYEALSELYDLLKARE